jgi:hypothetical protein
MKIQFDKSIKHDLDKYFGKPSIIIYVLNNTYEIEIQMKEGWDKDELILALSDSFIVAPKDIYVKSIHLDIIHLN